MRFAPGQIPGPPLFNRDNGECREGAYCLVGRIFGVGYRDEPILTVPAYYLWEGPVLVLKQGYMDRINTNLHNSFVKE